MMLLKTLALTALFGFCSARTAAAQVSESDKASIVALHNAARNSVSPPAANMQPMVWDDACASIASNWASRCQTVHSHTSGFGENLAWGAPSQSLEEGFGLWLAEKAQFNINGSPQSTGHYTQIVWASTTKVGCARQYCPGLLGQGGHLIVCEYAEAGNYLKGGTNLINSPYIPGQAQQTTQASAAPQQQAAPAPQAAPQQQQQQAAPAPQAAPADSFRWTGGDSAWGSCSASCGAGTQTRNIACVNQNNQGADWSKCDQGSKPQNSQSCDAGACPQAAAPQPAAAPASTSEPEAKQAAAPAPAAAPEVTYSWSTGDYSVCSAACAGSQTRTVVCKSSAGDVSADGACGGQERPASTQACNGECPKETPAAPEQPKTTGAAELVQEAPKADEPKKEEQVVEPEAVAACANATVIESTVALFNDTNALNASGLLRSVHAAQAPSSLNCSAVFTFLNTTGLFNCSAFVNSSAVNSTGGAYGAAYALGDCFDSWFNTSLSFVDPAVSEQTHFGTLNFTQAEAESDYDMQAYKAAHDVEAVDAAVAALPAATDNDDATVLPGAASTDDLSADATEQQRQQLQRIQQQLSAAPQQAAVSVCALLSAAAVALLLL